MNRESLAIATIFIALAALLFLAFIQGRAEFAGELAREAPVKSPSRVSISNHEAVITLDRAAQAKSGITAAPLMANSGQEQQVCATVLQTQELVDAHNGYVAARARLDKALAGLELARQDHERLKELHEDDHNVSDRAFHAGVVAMQLEEANVRAAQAALQASASSVAQRYGETVGAWLAGDAPAYERLLRQQEVLVQVAFPSHGASAAPPKNIRIQARENVLVAAMLASRLPRVDPRTQGLSFLYLAPAGMLVPGMNVLAYLPAGITPRSIVVPRAATVWWQGKTWVYLQAGTGRYVRREIPAFHPVEDGFVVDNGLTPNDSVVVAGAQLLLSEEFRAQIQIGEEGAGQ